jgi:hypothetical protein
MKTDLKTKDSEIYKQRFIVHFLIFAFLGSINAQESFNIEANVGVAIGDSSELHSYVLQGNLYYFWDISENIDLGLTTGALVFLGNASEGWCEGCPFDDYEAELYIPLATAFRASLSKKIAVGLDLGYAFYVHVFDDGGGFYFRPIVAYNLNEKLALTISNTNVSESEYVASSINIGINFSF